MYFQKEIETLPLAQLRQLQNKRVQKLVSYLYRQVPFYRRKLDENRIDPKSIKRVDDLPQLPFTLKSDLRDNYPFDLFAVPQDQIIRIHCSSGTTGKPIVVAYTRDDLETFAEVNARSLMAAGARPGMKLHNAYGYGLFTGGLGLHYGAERLGMSVIPVSGGMTDRQIMLLQDFQSEVIACTPSYALTLAEAIQNRGINPQNLNLKYAVLGAEPWTEVIRNDIENTLGIEALNIYGLSEIIGPGVSQEPVNEKGGGSTIWEDHFFPEIVNPDTGEPVPNGEDGVLVFTTLTKQAIPLIRYWTNDITCIYYDSNSSRTHIKMGPIKGRADDMLIIRGVNLYPTQVEEVLENRPQFSANYQLSISKKGELDYLDLRVELDHHIYRNLNAFTKEELRSQHTEWIYNLEKELESKIKNTIGLTIHVTIMGYDQLPRSTGGKLHRVIDKRKPN